MVQKIKNKSQISETFNLDRIKPNIKFQTNLNNLRPYEDILRFKGDDRTHSLHCNRIF